MWNRFLPVCVLSVTILWATACGSPRPQPSQAASPSGDASFNEVAHLYLEDFYRRQPTQATYLGIHTHDDQLEDYSRQAVADAVASARQFRDRVAAIDPKTLSPSNQLDREQLLHAIDSRLLTLEVVRPWAKDPDSYSSGLTNTAYIMIKRKFAPAAEAPAAADRAREGDAGRAGRGAEEPREPASCLHGDRHRADRRQSRLFRRRRRGRVSGGHRQGAAGRVQAGQRRRDRGARRLQEMAAGRSAASVPMATSRSAKTPIGRSSRPTR